MQKLSNGKGVKLETRTSSVQCVVAVGHGSDKMVIALGLEPLDEDLGVSKLVELMLANQIDKK